MIINSINSIKTSSGYLQAGMTRDEAKAQNKLDKWYRTDFNNIDVNQDGILSVNEIMAERKNAEKEAYLSSVEWPIIGLLLEVFENNHNSSDLLDKLDLSNAKPNSKLKSAFRFMSFMIFLALAAIPLAHANSIKNNNKKIDAFIKANNIDPNTPCAQQN